MVDVASLSVPFVSVSAHFWGWRSEHFDSLYGFCGTWGFVGAVTLASMHDFCYDLLFLRDTVPEADRTLCLK